MARRHTGGWDLLGLDADPTPGDTEAIRAVASAYGGIAEQAERAYLLLRGARINDGAGDAMRELNARVGELPDKLRRTSESFHRVAVAYDRYAGTLETAQGRLDQAIDQAEAVHATASLDLPDRPAAGASAAETGEFERQTGRIESAREQLGAAERLAADARALREDGSGAGWGSRQVERELDDAAAAAIPERDLWDRTVDLFDDAGEAIDEFFTQHPWVETVLQIAVGILTIAFPVLGLVLGAVLLLVQAWRMAATGNWDVTALAIGVLALAGGGIIRGLALAGRLGPVATVLRAASARTGTMQGAVTRATAGLRSAGRTVGTQVRAAVRPVLGRRTDAVVRAGREGLTEGASEAVVDVAVKVATGQEVRARDVLANAGLGTVTGVGGRALADGVSRPGSGDVGDVAAPADGSVTTAAAAPPEPTSVAPAGTPGDTGAPPVPSGGGPDPARPASVESPSAVVPGDAGASPAAGGVSDEVPAVGSRDAGPEPVSGARPDPATPASAESPSAAAPPDRVELPEPSGPSGSLLGSPGRAQDLVVDEQLIHPASDPLVDPRAPGVQTPFRQADNLAPDTDFVVVDRNGQHRGVFSTDESGRIVEVTTPSSAFEAFQLDPDADVRYLRDRLNPDLTNRPPPAHGVVPADPQRYTNLLPNVTYHVDGRYTVTTDHLARVTAMDILDVELRTEPPPRSAAQQRNAAQLGRDEYPDVVWNGGHVDANRHGGIPEGVNQQAMLESLNQRRTAHPDNWYAFEQQISAAAADGNDIRRRITFDYDGDSRVPHLIDVTYQVGTDPPVQRPFDNRPEPSAGAAAQPSADGPPPEDDTGAAADPAADEAAAADPADGTDRATPATDPADPDGPSGHPTEPAPDAGPEPEFGGALAEGDPARSFENNLDSVLTDHGLTRAEFHGLALRDTETLTAEEARTIHDVRHAVRLDSETVVAKVLSPAIAERYLAGSTEDFDATVVGGFVARLDDIEAFHDPAGVYEGLALDYVVGDPPTAPFSPDADLVFSMRFPAGDSGAYAVPFGGHSPDATALVELGPGDSGISTYPTFQDPPFTGTGFTASQDHVVPEFTRNPRAQVPDGARIYQTDRNGKDTLVATFDSEIGWTRVEDQR